MPLRTQLKQDDWGAMLGKGIEDAVSNGLAQYHRFKRLSLEKEAHKSQMQTDALRRKSLEIDIQLSSEALNPDLVKARSDAILGRGAEGRVSSILADEFGSKASTETRAINIETGLSEAKTKSKLAPGREELEKAQQEFKLKQIKAMGEALSRQTWEATHRDPIAMRGDSEFIWKLFDTAKTLPPEERLRFAATIEHYAKGKYPSETAQLIYYNEDLWNELTEGKQTKAGELRRIQERMNLDILGGGAVIEGREGEEVRGLGDLFGPRSSGETKPFPAKDALNPPKRMGLGSNREQKSTSNQIVTYADDLVKLNTTKGPKAVKEVLARLRKSRPDLYSLVQAEMERREDSIKFRAQSLFGIKE